MEKENRELKQLVESLKDELCASMRREELLLNPTSGKGGVKQKLKKTKLGKIASDPNSKLGKIVRSPRTIFRLATHPEIIKDMRKEKTKNKKPKNVDNKKTDLFVPIEFFYGEDDTKRVNLVVEKVEKELFKKAIEFANKNNMELRVVTFGESASPIEYKKLVDKKVLPKAKKISFYSSVDQSIKNDVFELEIGKNDIFLTLAWSKNENQ